MARGLGSMRCQMYQAVAQAMALACQKAPAGQTLGLLLLQTAIGSGCLPEVAGLLHGAEVRLRQMATAPLHCFASAHLGQMAEVALSHGAG